MSTNRYNMNIDGQVREAWSNKAGWTLNGVDIYCNATGNIGIGTANPSTLLHISGDEPKFTVQRTDNAKDSSIQFLGEANFVGAYFKHIEDESGAGGTNNDLAIGTGSTVAERMRIRGDGNVGIGTASPARKLHVASEELMGACIQLSQHSDDAFHRGYAAQKARGTIASPTAVEAGDALGGINFQGYSGGNFATYASIASKATGSSTGGNPGPADIFLSTSPNAWTSPIERLTIKDSGNIGIGTTSPTALLDVAGEVKAREFGWGSTHSAYGVPRYRINEFTDVLWGSDLRFGATMVGSGLVDTGLNPDGEPTEATAYSVVNDSYTGATVAHTGAAGALFDGDYNSKVDLAFDANSPTTHKFIILMRNNAGTDATGIDYPQGKFYVSFFNTHTNFSSVKLRSFNLAQTSSTDGTWHDCGTPITDKAEARNISAPYSGGGTGDYAVLAFDVPASPIRLCAFELTIVVPPVPVFDSTSSGDWHKRCSPSTINYYSDRISHSDNEIPYVSKYRATNRLYGPLLHGDGLSSAPTVSFISSDNTGLYYDDAGSNLRVASGGTDAIEIDSSGHVSVIGGSSGTSDSSLEINGAFHLSEQLNPAPTTPGAGAGGMLYVDNNGHLFYTSNATTQGLNYPGSVPIVGDISSGTIVTATLLQVNPVITPTSLSIVGSHVTSNGLAHPTGASSNRIATKISVAAGEVEVAIDFVAFGPNSAGASVQYTNPTITVDNYGRIELASNGSGSSLDLLGSATSAVTIGDTSAITSIKTAGYVAVEENVIIQVNTSSNPVTITLYEVQNNAGRIICIKDVGGNASNNNITIDANLAETIDGRGDVAITNNHGSLSMFCNGTGWFII